jgi:hypothetical protein
VFYEECSKLLHQRKQVKIERLQDQKQIDGENLNEVRRETSRYFRSKIEGISEGHG